MWKASHQYLRSMLACAKNGPFDNVSMLALSPSILWRRMRARVMNIDTMSSSKRLKGPKLTATISAKSLNRSGKHVFNKGLKVGEGLESLIFMFQGVHPCISTKIVHKVNVIFMINIGGNRSRAL